MVPSEASTDTDTDGAFRPRLFTFAHGPYVLGMQWPRIEDELSITRQLQSISTSWRISVLTNAAPSLHTRFATEATAFSYEDLLAAEARNKNIRRSPESCGHGIGDQEEENQTGPWPC